jgi:hypothetical protein
VDKSVGFTMLTFGAFYRAHLKRAFSLATLEEQVSWLDDAALQFHLALGVIQIQLGQFILSTQPDLAKMVCILPRDCAPLEHLRRKKNQPPAPRAQPRRHLVDQPPQTGG